MKYICVALIAHNNTQVKLYFVCYTVIQWGAYRTFPLMNLQVEDAAKDGALERGHGVEMLP
jgi:hypothetical protein